MSQARKKTIKIEVSEEGNRIISFDYVKDFVDDLKEGVFGVDRKYYPEDKYWIVIGTRYDTLLKRLAVRHFDEAYWQFVENWEIIILDLKTGEQIKQKNLFGDVNFD